LNIETCNHLAAGALGVVGMVVDAGGESSMTARALNSGDEPAQLVAALAAGALGVVGTVVDAGGESSMPARALNIGDESLQLVAASRCGSEAGCRLSCAQAGAAGG
jgi:hypothetical protein